MRAWRAHAPDAGAAAALPARRGGILLEVVLSVALFAGAAAFTMASVRSVFRTLEQARLRQEAIDLARSKMSELEAGLINLTDLRGNQVDRVGSVDLSERSADVVPAWDVEVATQRTEFTGLSLVRITVTQAGRVEAPMRHVLQQLVPLGRSGQEPSSP